MRKNHALILSPFCDWAGFLSAILLVAAFAPTVFAQTAAGPSQPLITQPVDGTRLTTLSGNTHGAAKVPAARSSR